MSDDSFSVKLLERIGNRAIVQLPGRAFPAIAIQGDTFSNLVALAREIKERTAGVADDDLRDAAEDLHTTLQEILSEYEHALQSRSIRLPYVKEPERIDPSMAPSTDGWIPFVYRGFHDVPLMLVTTTQNSRFVLDLEFDDELDDFASEYKVFVGEPRNLHDSWDELVDPSTLRYIGALVVKDLVIYKKGKLLDPACLSKIRYQAAP